jgi:TusA-related sulfurtransferase
MNVQAQAMKSFDLRDTIIPFSLLQIAHHFQHMAVGEEIEICGDEADIGRDLQSILPSSAAVLHTVATCHTDRPRFRWRLKKEMSLTNANQGGASCQKSI